jgi:hypothetical protein
MAFIQQWLKMAQKPQKAPFIESILDTPVDPLTSDKSYNDMYNPRTPYMSNKYTITDLYKGRSAEIDAMNNTQRNAFLFQNDPYTLYNASTFSTAPDGVYLWVFSTEHGFYALRAYSKAEIGTKHLAITKRVRKLIGKDIFSFKYAGELLKEGKSIQINLFSGTFMAFYINNLLERYTITLEELNKIILERAKAALQDVMPEFKVEISPTPMNTFIANNISDSERNRLLERGYTVTERSAGGKRSTKRRRIRSRKLRH